jgi:hypothetical protein
MKPALFSVLCEIKEKTGKSAVSQVSTFTLHKAIYSAAAFKSSGLL